jgi:hypothetical protein
MMSIFAFPNVHNPLTGTQESGMTLRDYFAAMALTHFAGKNIDWTPEIEENIAKGAYQIADAMMRARDL